MSKSGEHVEAITEIDLTYGEALEELDAILVQLESAAVDVDALADHVARGAALVRFCRQRLGVVRSDVNAIVDELLDDGVEPTVNGSGS